MTEAERLKLGEERRLIFENVANCVPIEQIMTAFRRSKEEVEREIAFVAKKIREYRFRRRMPPLECDDVRSIMWNRRALLENIAKLGPDYLSSDLLIPRITIQRANSASDIREVAHRAGARVTG